MQRSLRERRERSDLLDVVSEELDAKWLATRAREDVDEASPDGDLTSFLDSLDPLVSPSAQRLDERVEAGAVGASEWITSGRASSGGMPSASARAETQTSPPAARTSSARARSPTRCAGGSSPESTRTPRLGSSPTRAGSTYQPIASATSRASSSSARRRARGRSRAVWSVARTSGSAGSETRAFAGKSSTNARKRSLEASSVTRPASGVRDGSIQLAGIASRGLMVTGRTEAARIAQGQRSRPSADPARARTDKRPQGHSRVPTSTLPAIASRVGSRDRQTSAADSSARAGRDTVATASSVS